LAQGNTADLDGSKERRGILCVPGSDATPAFEVKEGVLNEMP